MKHIVRLLLALILCGCVVLFPVQAQVIDPAAEVEQYLAGEDMTCCKGCYSAGSGGADGTAGDQLFFEAHFHAGGASVEDFD